VPAQAGTGPKATQPRGSARRKPPKAAPGCVPPAETRRPHPAAFHRRRRPTVPSGVNPIACVPPAETRRRLPPL